MNSSTKTEIFIRKIFHSHYCKIVFLISLLLIYLILPKFLRENLNLIGWAFVISSAFVITCISRNIKEKIILSHKAKSSIFVTFATALGIISLQFCTIGAPVCGATISIGLISFLPLTFSKFFENHASIFLISSIILQFIGLYFMNCFKKVKN